MTGPGMRRLALRELDGVLRAGDSARRESDLAPRFKPGDRVRSRKMHPAGHTRLPRYARACVGEVVLQHGVFVFPDSNAASGDPRPQHCYAVRFSMRELWGNGASQRDSVTLDLFDEYLEPA